MDLKDKMTSSSDAYNCDNHFSFECAYDFDVYHQWMVNRPHLPVVAVVVYLLVIYYGQKLMQNRKPFNVKYFLFAWNASLAAFSILGTVRAVEEIRDTISKFGFHPSICVTNANRMGAFWVFAFAMSKFVELGDTFFLIIRKRNLMFLHWYHHVTVLLFTWYAVVSESSTGRYFISMNLFVHSLMYTYFALQTINIKAPLFVSMTITTMQIMQMVGGIYAIVYSRNALLAGETCAQTFEVINSGLMMYGSYFILFLHFFLQAYVFNKKPRKPVEHSQRCCKSEMPLDHNSNNIFAGVTESLKNKVLMMTKSLKHDLNSNHIKGL
jgi:elongation of very long chain fatty acids protein 6